MGLRRSPNQLPHGTADIGEDWREEGMSVDEQRIFVAEWMGWDFDPIEAREWESQISNRCWCKNPDTCKLVIKFGTGFPPLTLDWMHSCWLKLPPEQKEVYIWNLWNLVTDMPFSTPSPELLSWGTGALIILENSTAEQRLAALVETIKTT